VNELWATFDFLMPNFLGSSTLFAKEYAKPIAKSLLPVASATSVNTGIEKLKVLHQQVLPFILRREKEQVLQELPPKTITIVRVAMSELQSKIYAEFCTGSEVRKSLAALNAAVQGAQSGDDDQKAELNLDLGTDALKALLFLRLLCTHPFLVSPNPEMSRTENNDYFTLGASGKILALAELLRDAGIYRDELAGADNDASLLYCNNDTEETDTDLSVLNADVESSPAIEGDYDDVQNGSKCLIFAQFTRSLDVVEEFLLKPHMPSLRYLRLDGRVPARKRTELVDSFNRDPSIKLMLLTTRAGGLGLNLTGKWLLIA
jgi:TATA-binding protein-associated factor